MSRKKDVGVIILAAGYASRMGVCKALLDLGGKPALEGVVSRFAAAGVKETVVVSGSYREEVEARARELGCVTAFNENFDRGMYSSVLTGVKALSEEVEAFLLLPVDIPLVKEATVRVIIEAWNEDKDIVYPSFLGRKGHPPLISRKLIPEILNFDGDGGLRVLLARHDDESVVLPVPDEGILLDMDTPEDYRRLQLHIVGNAFPTAREIEALLEMHGTPEKVRAHCRAVSRFALELAEVLKGYVTLDVPLLESAALLHDLARTQADHAAAGADILERWNYTNVAALVREHMDLEEGTPLLSETAILYLADKMTGGEILSTLDKRESLAERKFAADGAALDGVRRRFRKARAVRAEVERVTGRKVEEILG